MKKFLLVLTLGLIAFTATACGGGDDDDDDDDDDDPIVDVVNNEAPELSGVDNASIVVGDDFDPLEGVSASDEEDGDITSDITILGEVDASTAGTYVLTYIVIDSDGASALERRAIAVTEAPEEPEAPYFEGVDDETIPAGTAGFDVEEGVQAFNNPTDETELFVYDIEGTVDTETEGTYIIEYTVTNNEDLTTVVEREIQVVNESPTLSFPKSNIIAAGDSDYHWLDDVEYGDPGDLAEDLTVTIEVDGAAWDEETNDIDRMTEGTYEVEITVEDSFGDSITMSKTYEVVNHAPVIEAEDMEVPAGTADFDLLDHITVTDTGDSAITPSLSGDTVDRGVVDTYNVTITATDSLGVATTMDIEVEVIDEDPEITVPEDSEVIAGTGVLDLLDGVTATDAGDAAEDVEITGVSLNGDAFDLDTDDIEIDLTNEGVHMVEYTAEDSFGNTATVTRTITVYNEPPVIEGANNVTIPAGDLAFDPLDEVTISDSGDVLLDLDITVGGDTVDRGTEGEYDVTITVEDSLGATVTAGFTVTVEDVDPVLDGLNDRTVPIGTDDFDLLTGISASDPGDEELTVTVSDDDGFDADTAGEYTVEYSVTDSLDNTVTGTRVVEVVDTSEAYYPTGTFNYKFASADLRHELFAAAEKYLLNTMDGGIPVFSNSGFVMYSDRMNLPVTEYVPIMGYSAMLGTMTEDDSNVEMDDGSDGEAGEYTYRTSLGQDPSTLLHWVYDDATSSDVITNFIDALYYFDFNDDKDGYEVLPSMADGMPVPVESETLDTGVEVAKTWQVNIKDDLMWTFHEDTPGASGFDDTIDAEDFIDTYKLALDEGWFRAISGGGDFFTAPQKIKNAQEYYDGEVAWTEVGLRVDDDYTLEFEFVENIDEWGVIYWLSSFVTTPINMDLYDAVGDSYGTSPETTAYNGPFVLDYWERDKIIRMSENDNFHDPDRYFITGLTMAVIEDANVRWQEFLAGRLDAGTVPTEEFEQYETDDRLLEVPGATTFRIMINGLGTPEQQQEQFPGSSYTPEPILSNYNFKRAMYFGIDRWVLAKDVMITSTPQPFHFTESYLVEPKGGVAFRMTPQADDVAEGLSPDTYGFNEDAAVDFWEAAIEEMVDDGIYEEGDRILLELAVFSGSESQALFGDYIKTQFEEIFVHEDLDIAIEVDVVPRDFPGIYYDYMMIGNFDLSIGGISGSTLDAASFLDVYADDNRGGFTLNWGIDTSTAEIEVTYDHPEYDTEVTEIWSYNALVSALNGSVTVEDGEEVE
ncbi:MAG: immunoglobulin-like domain-containing protein [Bacillota bacterium]